MPVRKMPLVTNEIYHVFNRGFNKQKIFLNHRDYLRAQISLVFYQFTMLMKYSHFRIRSQEKQKEIIDKKRHKKKYLADIISYCLMPNHFHLLIKQIEDEGIRKILSNFSNSYSHYFNTKYNKKGPVFEGRFKAVLIENEEQLVHVNRYIHLNPYSAEIIKSLNELKEYKYSSLREYLGLSETGVCDNKDMVLDLFKSKDSYQRFVLDYAEHQRSLKRMEKLLLDFEY